MKESLPLHTILKMQKRHHKVCHLATVYLRPEAHARFRSFLDRRSAMSQSFPADEVQTKVYYSELNRLLRDAALCLASDKATKRRIPPRHWRSIKKWYLKLFETGFVPVNS